MSNLLQAIVNIVKNPVNDLVSFYDGSNRANNMGDALEVYIKDAFCNSFEDNNNNKDIKYSEIFSYLGNQNNPPDIILKNSDAIEVKKLEGLRSALALNSSYPKDKLYCDDSRITSQCKEVDGGNWLSKDILYVVGSAPNSKLYSLFFVYGDCYAADRSIYSRVSDKISSGIKEIPDVELVETNELAKVKKVDPLGITDLRVRGMRHIDNPIKVFGDFVDSTKESDFSIYVILKQEKYMSFPEADRMLIESIDLIAIEDVMVRNPNNPSELFRAKFISYGQ